MCCDVRYDFLINAMFGSSLPPLFVGGLMFYLCCLCLFAHSGIQHILCCVFLRLVYPVLPVSLDCPFFIAPSVFSNVKNNCSVMLLYLQRRIIPIIFSIYTDITIFYMTSATKTQKIVTKGHYSLWINCVLHMSPVK